MIINAYHISRHDVISVSDVFYIVFVPSGAYLSKLPLQTKC